MITFGARISKREQKYVWYGKSNFTVLQHFPFLSWHKVHMKTLILENPRYPNPNFQTLEDEISGCTFLQNERLSVSF